MYESKDNMVSHPSHYNKGGMEVIDVIEAFTEDLSGIEAVDTANAIKYILRWKSKNGKQDIEKAIWYLTHLKEHLENGKYIINRPLITITSVHNENGKLIGISDESEQYVLHFDPRFRTYKALDEATGNYYDACVICEVYYQ